MSHEWVMTHSWLIHDLFILLYSGFISFTVGRSWTFLFPVGSFLFTLFCKQEWISPLKTRMTHCGILLVSLYSDTWTHVDTSLVICLFLQKSPIKVPWFPHIAFEIQREHARCTLMNLYLYMTYSHSYTVTRSNAYSDPLTWKDLKKNESKYTYEKTMALCVGDWKTQKHLNSCNNTHGVCHELIYLYYVLLTL